MGAPVLLIACYELGHQPLSLAWPLALLRAAGIAAEAVDLAVDPLPPAAVKAARLVAIAVPMHTALRVGVDAACRVRSLNPDAYITCYGLYAWLNRDYLLGAAGLEPGAATGPATTPVADAVLAGECEPTLVALAQALLAGDDPGTVPGVTTRQAAALPQRTRLALPVPDRSGLPGLDQYAAYIDPARHGQLQGQAGQGKVGQGKAGQGKAVGVRAGYVEATRGCLHTCRHCPVTPVYQGRFFAVPAAVVLADIRQQVAAGAQHITFGDPDFLNGPGHARTLAQQLHAEFPDLTWDFTAKVEHLVAHRALLPALASNGATFVVSAFESTSDAVLARLAKGHTVADMDAALDALRSAGLAPRPTWLPFTPWAGLEEYLHLLDWVRTRGLIPNVPAVQLAIRLLIPPASALLAENQDAPWLGPLDAPNFGYTWTHPDPRLDELQRTVTCIAEQASDDDPYPAFAAIERAAYAAAGRSAPPPAAPPPGFVPPPRLSEHWFC